MPQLSYAATWYPDGIVIAESDNTSSIESNIFVSKTNSIYLPESSNNQILIWENENFSSIRNISDSSLEPFSVFLTAANNLYIGNGSINSTILEWNSMSNETLIVSDVPGPCHTIFIDRNYTLYCSISSEHQVVKI